MSRMSTYSLAYEDVYEDVTEECGPYLPTLTKKLEAGDFA